MICHRCMACDRPLAKLDPDMGGFVPSPHMPVSVSLEPSKNNGVVLANKDGAGQGRSGAARKGPPAAQQSKTAVPQTGELACTHTNTDVQEMMGHSCSLAQVTPTADAFAKDQATCQDKVLNMNEFC